MLTKNEVGLAGEMRVTSELLLKGYRASITFGNAKATDIVILGDDNSFVRVRGQDKSEPKEVCDRLPSKVNRPNNHAPRC